MAINVTKPAINLREKLNEVTLETGIKGEELLNSDTSAEARNVLELDTHLFTDFESTGIDDNATSTAITIDASETVALAGALTIAGNTAGKAFTSGSSVSDPGKFTINDNSTTAYTCQWNGLGTRSYGFTVSSSGSASSTTFNSAAGAGGVHNVNITNGALSLLNGNLVIGTAGKGIDFSATANGSGTTTSELLDDYEQGTFTATLKGGTAEPATLLTSTGAVYTKVGRMVTVKLWFNAVNTTGYAGSVTVTGLPFTNGAGAASGSVSSYNLATWTGQLGAELLSGGTTINLNNMLSNSGWNAVTHSAKPTSYLYIAVTYQT